MHRHFNNWDRLRFLLRRPPWPLALLWKASSRKSLLQRGTKRAQQLVQSVNLFH